MKYFRLTLCWFFLWECVLSLPGLIYRSLRVVYLQYGFLPVREQLKAAYFVALIVIFGVAFWTFWTAKRSARSWGIAASSAYILIYLQPLIFLSGLIWWHSLGALFLGIAGLIAFSPPRENWSEIRSFNQVS